MARTKKTNGDAGTPISIHQHSDAARLNIPEATQAKTDVPKSKKLVYRYSPHLSPKLCFDSTGAWDKVQPVIEKAITGQKLTLDEAEILRAVAQQGSQPWLEWANKQEQEGRGKFCVDDVVLHVHERVSAKAIIASVQREETEHHDLFARPKLHREQALQYYKHNVDWANRLILGDSLQVMSSLANRENLAGKVQMIYIDPPYGIKFSSNWQNEVGNRDVKDKDDDLSREPETIRAYRDTWSLGVHSYLAYIKQRLIVAKELLKDGADGTGSGSVFVQISDENMHRVRILLDEIFGPENFFAQVNYRTMTALGSSGMSNVYDYILWYARDKTKLKYRPIYEQTDIKDDTEYSYIAGSGGSAQKLTKDEKLRIPDQRVIFKRSDLNSSGFTSTCVFPFEFQGNPCSPSGRKSWRTNPEGMKRLISAERLFLLGEKPYARQYLGDFGCQNLENSWHDTAAGFTDKKVYIVQTSPKVIERCLLMTTDPGDLVIDPTCGSGTTASVAEQWGRRWITIDSSRIAVALARQRLLTATYESYKTKDPTAGVDPTAPQNPAHGFYYKTVPHIMLGNIAQNRNLDPIFTKYEPLLALTLSELNKALADIGSELKPLHSKLVAKLRSKFANEGARAITDAELRRWLLPSTDTASLTFGTPSQRAKWKEAIPTDTAWKEWEVPFDSDPDWPKPLAEALSAYRRVWQTKIDLVNACILANADQEELVNMPEVVPNITRVSGPFSVEGVRPEELALGEDGKLFDPTTNNFEDLGSSANADSYIDLMISLLKKDGVTFLGNRRAEFATLEKEAGKSFHARGNWKGREDGPTPVAVVFGPQYGPLNAPITVEAIEAARNLKEINELVLAAYSFDVAAQQKAKEMSDGALHVHLAHIRPDVSPGMQGLLKETPNSQLFTVFGQPDIRVLPAGDGEYKVEMNGVCIYNPLTGAISDTPSKQIAAWFIDTDYDGRCFCFSQAFFPDKTAWDKIAKALGSSVPESTFQAFTTSWPFKPGQHNRIAVKVIDPRGNEVMAIKTLNT